MHPNLDNMLQQHYTQTFHAKPTPRRRREREPLLVDLLIALAAFAFLYWMCP